MCVSFQIVEDLSYTDLGVRGYHKRSVPLHMEPQPSMLMSTDTGFEHKFFPLPVSDALDKHAPELPLINNVQQNTRIRILNDTRLRKYYFFEPRWRYLVLLENQNSLKAKMNLLNKASMMDACE
ncbi:uncharacterized protein CEXT_278621 [Caerostris extrusa]|uniref:Uncharacterized protein n=1 Tax=Caerostris extrusa TaxID=172846 RepID=A0AAV4XPA4_CAEEX|nr:uncharacterized protein CEXT_278621 [Caerostris extrusa]